MLMGKDSEHEQVNERKRGEKMEKETECEQVNENDTEHEQVNGKRK